MLEMIQSVCEFASLLDAFGKHEPLVRDRFLAPNGARQTASETRITAGIPADRNTPSNG